MYFNYHEQAPKNSQSTSSIINSLKEQIMDLQSENQSLKTSIYELNECYSEKIEILQEQLQRYKGKYEQLLEEKKGAMDVTIAQTNRYQLEIEKVINITETLHTCFEEEKQKMRALIEEKDQQLAEMQQRSQQDRNKVQELARKYIAEIGRLQNELRDLKQQGSHTKEESSDANFYQNSQGQDEGYQHQDQIQEQNPLKDISNKQIKAIGNGKKMRIDLDNSNMPGTISIN